ncbi:MAG: hypothetical protein LJF04_16880 [Gemmatimonadetes bacterium]|nr:hypothetical protein [Gemmatimonadota bacterium]
MAHLKRYAAVALAAAALGCSSSTEPQIDANTSLVPATTEVTLRYGEDRQLDNSVLRVTFARVVEDSRCPVDVVCVWAGNAVVEIGVAAGMGPTVPLQINATMDPRYADWNSVRVTVLELTPAPRSDTPIKPEDYSVKLRFESIR